MEWKGRQCKRIQNSVMASSDSRTRTRFSPAALLALKAHSANAKLPALSRVCLQLSQEVCGALQSSVLCVLSIKETLHIQKFIALDCSFHNKELKRISKLVTLFFVVVVFFLFFVCVKIIVFFLQS